MTSFPPFHQLVVVICTALALCIPGSADATTSATSQSYTTSASEVTTVTALSIEKPTTSPSNNLTTIQSTTINNEENTNTMHRTTGEETTDVITTTALETTAGGQSTSVNSGDVTDNKLLTTGAKTSDALTTIALGTTVGGQSTSINNEESTDIMNITTGKETTGVLTTAVSGTTAGGQSTSINTEDGTLIKLLATGEKTTSVFTTTAFETTAGGQSTSINSGDGTDITYLTTGAKTTDAPTTISLDTTTGGQSTLIIKEDSIDITPLTTGRETTDILTTTVSGTTSGGQSSSISTEDGTLIKLLTTGEKTTDVLTTTALETTAGGQSISVNNEDSADIMHLTNGKETTDVLTTIVLETAAEEQPTTISTEFITNITHQTTTEEVTDVLTATALGMTTGQSTKIIPEDSTVVTHLTTLVDSINRGITLLDGTTVNDMTTVNPIVDTEIATDQVTSKVDSQSDFTTYEYLSFLTDDVTVTEIVDSTNYVTSPAKMPKSIPDSTEIVEVTSVFTEMASPLLKETSTTINDRSVEDLVTLVTESEKQTMVGSSTTHAPSSSGTELTDDDDGEGATEITYTENYVTEVYETISVSDVTDVTNGTSRGASSTTDRVQPDANNTTPKGITPSIALITPTPSQSNTTNATLPDLTENYVIFQLFLDMSVKLTDDTFVNELEAGLAKVISQSTDDMVNNVRKRRFSRFESMLRHSVMKRATNGDVTVQIHNLTRNDVDPRIVDTYFTVEINGTVLPSTEAASKFENTSISRLSASLGYEVISIPTPLNLPDPTQPTSVELDNPTGDLHDFLMMIILVPLTIDIEEPAFQTDLSNGIEAIYLAGMTSSNRKRRDSRVLLDGRLVGGDTYSHPGETERVDSRENEFTVLREEKSTVKTFLDGRFIQDTDGETYRLRRKRQLIEDPSHEYAVNLKSVNRPKANEMDVTVVFAVLLNGEVVAGKEALSRLEKLSLRFMTTVLGYQVQEPGIVLFDDSSSIDHILWIIAVVDVGVILILVFILMVYCLCKKNKQIEVHKQAVMSKADRSTSIEMGFVRIGVQSSDQMAIQEAASTILEKSGAHAMHGTVRDKLTRKRQRKKGIYNKQTNMNIDSSSDEETSSHQDSVRPSQLFAASNRVHPSAPSALVLHTGGNGEYSKEEYVPKFKKRDDDENMRRQQQLQAQLNREMASRLGAVKSEKSGFQQQIDDLVEGASNLNITDRERKISKKKRKFKRENVYHQTDIPDSVEVSENPRIKGKKKKKKRMNIPVAAQRAPTKAIHLKTMKVHTRSSNSFDKPNQAFESTKDIEEITREELHRELRRRWKKERKRISKFLDESFRMTISLLDNTNQSRVTYLNPPGALPPIRETPLASGPYEPYPYLYHHSVGPVLHRPLPVYPNVIQENEQPGTDHQSPSLKTEEEMGKQGQGSTGVEKQMDHEIKWTNSLKTFQPKERSKERPVRLSDEKDFRKKKRR